MDQQMNFSDIIDQICEEKGISRQDVVSTIAAALAAAYRKDFGEKNQNVEAEFDEKTLKTTIFDVKEVVEEINEDNKRKRGIILLEDAKKLKKGAEVGDIIRTKIEPPASYGRIAAQTAKQVIIQRIREAERTTIFERFKDKQGQVINGIVQRVEEGKVFIDIGQASAILYPREQLKREVYTPNQRIKIYIAEVRMSSKGPEIVISRSHPEMVRRLFELEVPEIHTGIVVINAVAREAGSRSKIAVSTTQDGVDPVGACVGQRGTRVQTIIAELAGEKIDIIEWDKDPVVFIAKALSPAKVQRVEVNEETREAKAYVQEDQLSLAIGKEGQNVRLAAKLSDWKIDIVKGDDPVEEGTSEDGEKAGETTKEKSNTEEAPKEGEAESKSTKEDKKKEVDQGAKEKSE